MWRQDDLFGALDAGTSKHPVDRGLAALRQTIPAFGRPRQSSAGVPADARHWPLQRPVDPDAGGSVVTMAGRHFDAGWAARHRRRGADQPAVDRRRRLRQAAPAGPRRRARALGRLLAAGHRLERRHLVRARPRAARRHTARLIMVDTLGSSEAIGMAPAPCQTAVDVPRRRRSASGPTPRSSATTAARLSGARARWAGWRSAAGSPRLLQGPEKSAATFQIIDGVRYSIPGDFATVDADGTCGCSAAAACINTGGEKVYPEEVEEALKLHPTVADAAVVGVPDERFGEAITALVEPQPATRPSDDELIEHVRRQIASFKAPRHIVVVPPPSSAAFRQARLPAGCGRRRSTPSTRRPPASLAHTTPTDPEAAEGTAAPTGRTTPLRSSLGGRPGDRR